MSVHTIETLTVFQLLETRYFNPLTFALLFSNIQYIFIQQPYHVSVRVVKIKIEDLKIINFTGVILGLKINVLLLLEIFAVIFRY